MADNEKINPVQYIFANRGAKMSPAKLAAQVAHASVLSFRHSYFDGSYEEMYERPNLCKIWMDSGHYTKIVLLAEDEQQLDNINDYLQERGIATFMVIDEGRTEVRPFTKTALGCEIVDKNDERIQEIFREFKIYKEEKPTFKVDRTPCRCQRWGKKFRK